MLHVFGQKGQNCLGNKWAHTDSEAQLQDKEGDGALSLEHFPIILVDGLHFPGIT